MTPPQLVSSRNLHLETALPVYVNRELTVWRVRFQTRISKQGCAYGATETLYIFTYLLTALPVWTVGHSGFQNQNNCSNSLSLGLQSTLVMYLMHNVLAKTEQKLLKCELYLMEVKEYRASRGIAQLIHNLDTRWRLINVTSRPLYPQEIIPVSIE
jgi:hypothetical protein